MFFESYQPVKQRLRRGGSMKRVNGFNPMSEEAKARLAALADRPDSEIDTSDIEEWSDEDFSKAVPFRGIYKPAKERITTWIDADILLWLKSYGKDYQNLLNGLLRKEMMEELRETSGDFEVEISAQSASRPGESSP